MLEHTKSKFILKKIFQNLKNRFKLKIIKYNRKLQKRLDIDKKDFEIYIILKEYNTKYNLSIIDIDINQIDLSYKKIGNEGIKIFKNITFGQLNDLNLESNEISYISDFWLVFPINK